MIISTQSLGHSYEKNPLFENISENLSLGDFLTIYGPSGVGKTTLLQILGRLIIPKYGSITFHTSLTDKQKDFGYAFIGGPFFEKMSVKENILFLEIFSNYSIDRIYYKELLDYFKLSPFENTKINTLSIGQRERVNIIRAFIHKPKIIIIDEPGSNLDDYLFQKLFDFFEKKIAENSTLFCVATHNEQYKKLATKNITLNHLF